MKTTDKFVPILIRFKLSTNKINNLNYNFFPTAVKIDEWLQWWLWQQKFVPDFKQIKDKILVKSNFDN